MSDVHVHRTSYRRLSTMLHYVHGQLSWHLVLGAVHPHVAIRREA